MSRLPTNKPCPSALQVCQHSYGLHEFYSMVNPSKTDITFRQARKSFPQSVLVGLVDANTGGNSKLCTLLPHVIHCETERVVICSNSDGEE